MRNFQYEVLCPCKGEKLQKQMVEILPEDHVGKRFSTQNNGGQTGPWDSYL